MIEEEYIKGKCLVAFIDICGFKKMVEEYFNGKNAEVLDILQNALQQAEKSNSENLNILSPTPIKIQFKQFSDCVSLSMSILSDTTFLIQVITFISLVRSYHRILMENGIFSRGGIAFDKHYETSNVIFSKGLIKAYKNESEIAVYPRIIIDSELAETIKEEMHSLNFKKLNDFIGTIIMKDWDGIYFINPFEYFWYMHLLPDTTDFTPQQIETRKKFLEEHNTAYSKIFKAVETNITKHKTDYNTQKKYLWLREFLEWHNKPTESKISFEKIA